MNIIVFVTCCYRDEITVQFFRLTRTVPAWFSSLASVVPLLPASVWHSAHRILIPDLLVVHPVHNEGYLRQQYAADIPVGGDAGYCTGPFIQCQFCLRVFCQECGKIIGYANFQWKKSSAFCAKMGKQRLHFFHAIVSKFMSPMRLAWKTASFLFFLQAGASGV